MTNITAVTSDKLHAPPSLHHPGLGQPGEPPCGLPVQLHPPVRSLDGSGREVVSSERAVRQ